MDLDELAQTDADAKYYWKHGAQVFAQYGPGPEYNPNYDDGASENNGDDPYYPSYEQGTLPDNGGKPS